jgi:hypothetical protein
MLKGAAEGAPAMEGVDQRRHAGMACALLFDCVAQTPLRKFSNNGNIFMSVAYAVSHVTGHFKMSRVIKERQ